MSRETPMKNLSARHVEDRMMELGIDPRKIGVGDPGTVGKPFGASAGPLTLALSPVGRGKLVGAGHWSWVPLAPPLPPGEVPTGCGG
jgi:hypothetical protein